MRPQNFRGFLFILIILNLSMYIRDTSPRALVEDVFNLAAKEGLRVGELSEIFVVPSRPYIFVACNESNHDVIMMAITTYDFSNGDWRSKGWINLQRGCQIIDSSVRGPIYGYAVSRDRTNVWNGSSKKEVGAPFCMDISRNFSIDESKCDDMSAKGRALGAYSH